MFESSTWYKEALILVVIIPLAGFFLSLVVPLPYNFGLYIGLLIAITIWRINKKALSGGEAITMILLSMGFNIPTKLFIPWPYSIIVSVALTFLIIWILHKRSWTLSRTLLQPWQQGWNFLITNRKDNILNVCRNKVFCISSFVWWVGQSVKLECSFDRVKYHTRSNHLQPPPLSNPFSWLQF